MCNLGYRRIIYSLKTIYWTCTNNLFTWYKCRWYVDCHPFNWSDLSVWIFYVQRADYDNTSYTSSRTIWSLNKSGHNNRGCCDFIGNFVRWSNRTNFMHIPTTCIGHVWVLGCFRCLCYINGNSNWFSVPTWYHTAAILDLCKFLEKKVMRSSLFLWLMSISTPKGISTAMTKHYEKLTPDSSCYPWTDTQMTLSLV